MNEQERKIHYLEWMVDELLEVTGPASDDVFLLLQEKYEEHWDRVPEEYRSQYLEEEE